MHRVIILALLLLAACASNRSESVAFRDAKAPIWSSSAFAPEQVAGIWQQVAAFTARPGSCRSGSVSVAPTRGGYVIRGSLCLDGEDRKIDALARPVGPGRLSVEGQEDWWVLWVDGDYRTLAVGTPSGRFGFVLDRGAIPQDRLTAAAEIFAFNGYTSGQLQPF